MVSFVISGKPQDSRCIYTDCTAWRLLIYSTQNNAKYVDSTERRMGYVILILTYLLTPAESFLRS
jgi:hypothetical protein